MDPYTPFLLEKGLRGMIGKGKEGIEVLEAAQEKPGCIFRSDRRNCGTLARSVMSVEKVAYEDLGGICPKA